MFLKKVSERKTAAFFGRDLKHINLLVQLTMFKKLAAMLTFSRLHMHIADVAFQKRHFIFFPANRTGKLFFLVRLVDTIFVVFKEWAYQHVAPLTSSSCYVFVFTETFGAESCVFAVFARQSSLSQMNWVDVIIEQLLFWENLWTRFACELSLGIILQPIESSFLF